MDLPRSERFAHADRLVRKADIDGVVRSGKRARQPHLDICWTNGAANHPRMGMIVPRFRQTAVARNRLRRRLREIWRRDLALRSPVRDVVLRARRESYDAPFAVLRGDLVDWCGATGW